MFATKIHKITKFVRHVVVNCLPTIRLSAQDRTPQYLMSYKKKAPTPGRRQIFYHFLNRVVPPEKGSFPLDRFKECNQQFMDYNECLVANERLQRFCNEYAKAYLKCRMEKYALIVMF